MLVRVMVVVAVVVMVVIVVVVMVVVAVAVVVMVAIVVVVVVMTVVVVVVVVVLLKRSPAEHSGDEWAGHMRCAVPYAGHRARGPSVVFQSLDCYMTRSHTPSLVDLAPCLEGGFFGGLSSVS